MKILILIPIFNDWVSAQELLQCLDQTFAACSDAMSVLIVDDGSTVASAGLMGHSCTKLDRISILRLKKNVGHQRALAIGLCYVSEKMECDAVLVMDGDGEDRPKDAFRLVQTLKGLGEPKIVFAERTQRSESFPFRLGYNIYRIIHYVMTGLGIHVGNFSIIPIPLGKALTVEPLLWNHYAASAIRSKLPVASIPTKRGKRIQGNSHFNFVGLVVHGLSALACYNEIIGVRLIFFSGLVLLFAFLGLTALLAIKFFTSAAIPGWTSILASLLVIMILQIGTLVGIFTMQIISARTLQPFLPARDYSWFVSELKQIPRKET